MNESNSPVEEILSFWFGTLDETGGSDGATKKRWFTKDPAFDDEIRRRFSAIFALLISTPRPTWTESSRGTLAALIVLDQFGRNMFRDTPAMFAGDERARAFCYELVALGRDRGLPFALRTFSYMPLMHSERLVDQERCIELFQQFSDEAGGTQDESVKNAESLKNNVKYAISHRDIVARFGRFPHRNEILGRPSTPAEVAFLEQPGSRF